MCLLKKASQVTQDYSFNLPPIDGVAGYILTTNGLGDLQWLPGSTGGGSVSYIGISPPSGFMTVNGLGKDGACKNVNTTNACKMLIICDS